MTERNIPAQEPQEGSHLVGLTADEVASRVAAGDVNVDTGVKTRSLKTIARENICTLFNAMNVLLAAFVLFTGSLKNALFIVVIVCNTIIGIVQEIRSKRTTDRLSIVASSKATAVRDGVRTAVANDELVRDDVIILSRGDQVPADSVVVSGECSANESLLTGESDLIRKQAGDSLMSGSFVNAGTVHARVVHVGAENYAAKISAEAKQHKAVNSEIMNTLNRVIKYVSFFIPPIGILLFAREYFVSGTDLDSAILSTVSALVGMIPEGLILLTSTVLAVAVMRLAKSQVLVQQLYCIETLARVDVLCLDKTGTITTGDMEVAWVKPIEEAGRAEADDTATAVIPADRIRGVDRKLDQAASDTGTGRPSRPTEADRALAAIAAADENPNETARAIIAHYEATDVAAQPCARTIPFSSDKKWSGAVLADGSAYVMGAAQFVLGDAYETVREQAEQLASEARLLLVARVEGFTDEGDIIGAPVPVGFVGIRDKIRATAAETIGYFKEQGVRVLVISGDDPRTVSGIAAQVGVERADDFVDATTLRSDAELEAALAHASVFGRVKPEQKKAFVTALQKAGHTVAMTGDGVNDTLALKASDCGVAMAAGSDAARNVAHLVLVDNDFASMPKVVAEGRRSINNLQRSASLFLVKTLLSIIGAAAFLVLPWQYPFQPIQITLVSAFAIGIPSFVLALEPNHDRVKGHFLENVIVRSIPGAATTIVAVIALNIIGYEVLGLDYGQVSTLCTLCMAWVGANLVFRLSLPLTPIRVALLVVVVGGTVGGAVLAPGLFAISPFTTDMTMLYVPCAIVAAILFHVLFVVLDAWHAARQAKLV